MILTRAQMVDAEKVAIAAGFEARVLMESAGEQLAGFVIQQFPEPGLCRVYAGKGHNGGDVVVAARHLLSAGWEVETVFPDPALAPLTEEMRDSLPSVQNPAKRRAALVVLDGLLGIGARGNPREPVAGAIREINRLRRERAAWVLAADLPSGLDADTGEPGDPCVTADATMTIGVVKTGLVADAAVNFVGRLAVARLPGISPPPVVAGDATVLTASDLRPLLPPRRFDTHKGMAGRVAIVAGSAGFTGAARLCSAAAVAGGAGLVTLFADRSVYPLLAATAIPEVMVRETQSPAEVLQSHWDAVAIGPGLSTQQAGGILSVIRETKSPCVVDADALNVLAKCPEELRSCAGVRLLTPHPGEMERLSPCNGRSRLQWLSDFVQKYPVTLLLKGARTIIGEARQPVAYNATGTPGMASGGMGDVLTGISAALLAQGLKPYDAARVGAWICGRSAELASRPGRQSQESLSASHVIRDTGRAFQGLRACDF